MKSSLFSFFVVSAFQFKLVTDTGLTVHVTETENSGLAVEYNKDIIFDEESGFIGTVGASGNEIPPQPSTTLLATFNVADAPGTAVCIEGAIFYDQSNM